MLYDNEYCKRYGAIFGMVVGGVILVGVGLTPLWIHLGNNDEESCNDYALNIKFGGLGDLMGCNDTVKCNADVGIEGSNLVISCSLRSTNNLIAIKDSGVKWSDFIAKTWGLSTLFKYSICISSLYNKTSDNNLSCKNIGNNDLCLPYSLSTCPTSKTNLDWPNSIKNMSTSVNIPSTVHLTKDNFSEISTGIESTPNYECPTVCSVCSGLLVSGVNTLLTTYGESFC